MVFLAEATAHDNNINNITNKENPLAKPQPSSQLLLYPITRVSSLDKNVKLGFILWILTGPH
ncbi:hypothetical protein CN335_07125 [Bacillus thuringiensis]|nr:hypothetical protein BK762_30045 [Bacillus thuringiensis serovar toumanoffi]PFF41811.1 hypothetical protein CN335_07125 [Bacillus thuringiensis]PFT09765.1 hypothetical protein COK83_24180 [Bacillus thuringiensis]RFB53278.1 hypothetical protein DZB90_26740 [Bacillus thuringiensis]